MIQPSRFTTWRLSSLICCMLMLLFSKGSPQAQESTQAKPQTGTVPILSLEIQPVSPGGNPRDVELILRIANAGQLVAWSAHLVLDTTELTFQSAVPDWAETGLANFFKVSGGEAVGFLAMPSRGDPGRIALAAPQVFPAPASTSSQGVLAVLHMKAKSDAGEALLVMENAVALNELGQHDSLSVPEPIHLVWPSPSRLATIDERIRALRWTAGKLQVEFTHETLRTLRVFDTRGRVLTRLETRDAIVHVPVSGHGIAMFLEVRQGAKVRRLPIPLQLR